MASDLNVKDLRNEEILYFENALSHVFSLNEDNKRDVPTCIIIPDDTIKIGFPIYSIKNINKNENAMIGNENQNNRFNEEPLVAFASSSKLLFPNQVKTMYFFLFVLIFLQLCTIFFYRENINYVTTGQINSFQKILFIAMFFSHSLVPIFKVTKVRFFFDIYTSLSLLFFLFSMLCINSLSSIIVTITQFLIFYLHSNIDNYIMSHCCVIPP